MRIVSLEEVCEITMGQAPSGKSYNEQYQGIPLIAGAGDFGEFTPKPSRYTTEPSKVSSLGDIILCIRATIGDLNWSNQSYCLGRGVAGLRAIDSKLDSRYLWFWLETSKKTLLKQARGSTFKQIDKKALQNLSIPLPPLEEQKRIAAILDKADAIRRKRKEAIALTEELLRSTFLDMFGDPFTNPKGWEVLYLEQISHAIDYGLTLSATTSGSGPKFLRITDIQNDRVDWSTVPLCDFNSDECSKYELSSGDIVFARTGATTGKSFLVRNCPQGAVFASYLIRVRPSEKVDPVYLAHFFHTDSYWYQITKNSTGTTQAGVNSTKLKTLEVIVPPIKDQKMFVEIENKTRQYIHQIEVMLNNSNNLFNSLLQKAFRGEL